MLYKRFYSLSSDDDACTMFYDRNLINRRNVKVEAKKAYRPNKDFIITEVKARVVAAALKTFGMETVNSQPKSPEIPSDLPCKPKFEQSRFLHMPLL